MHSKNILRDIKAETIFLTKENVVKLGDFDFGISKILGTQKNDYLPLIITPWMCLPKFAVESLLDSKQISGKLGAHSMEWQIS